MVVNPKPRRFTVDEYYRMAEAGILKPDDRVELIEGEILEMSPIGSEHAGSTDGLNELFSVRCRGLVVIRVQGPIRLSSRSEPEPDLALLRRYTGEDTYYRLAHPSPRDVLLVVEVAQTSLSFDLGRKAKLYARHDVPEFWVLDLNGDRVVAHSDPGPRGYESIQILGRGESIAPLALPDISFTVDELLGPPR